MQLAKGAIQQLADVVIVHEFCPDRDFRTGLIEARRAEVGADGDGASQDGHHHQEDLLAVQDALQKAGWIRVDSHRPERNLLALSLHFDWTYHGMSTVVSLHGQLVAPDQAKISIFDRGFLYGDSVYEVTRTYDGLPFELDAHLERFHESAERIGMALPKSLEAIGKETQRVHDATGNQASYLRIIATRGAGEISLDPGLAEDPQLIIIGRPVSPLPPEAYRDGIKIALVSVRRNLRTALDPRAKTGNYLNSVMAVKEARQTGAQEAVMLDHQDNVTEGASSNVFAVFGKLIATPPLDVGILKGVTRTVIFEVAKRMGLRMVEMRFAAEALLEADEVFITSSVREIVPVAKVDDRTIGAGHPGSVYQQLREGFDAYVREYVARHRS
jgi:branched-chain amino acid aminotransferase